MLTENAPLITKWYNLAEIIDSVQITTFLAAIKIVSGIRIHRIECHSSKRADLPGKSDMVVSAAIIPQIKAMGASSSKGQDRFVS